jgi:pyridoxamine 5'-phosphate oxidase
VQDPIDRVRRWLRAAERAALPHAEAAALATANRAGAPSVRMVLVKQVDARGLVFFTDGRSRKGRELAENPRAALALFWDPLDRQVRVEGRVERVAREESDAYWASRSREKQLAARSSHQSAPLASRAALLARWRERVRTFADRPVPRPPEWTGFRIVPDAIEFWTRGPHRLHARERFTRSRGRWRMTRLQP